MSKIVKNTTGSGVQVSDTGITVSANGQYTIPAQDFDLWAASDDVILLVGNGTLIINNGAEDLNASDAIRLIQGGFSNKIQLDDDLLASERIKVDVSGMLSQGDGSVLVTSDDTVPQFLDGKIEAGSTKLNKTITNPGADETLVFDVVPSNINTTDLNNDAGFITSGEAPVQPADIANFETSTQLDARDTANRDRSNHTGTQLASTISDFAAAVQAAETVTTLSLSTNILTFTDESGNQTNLDLSIYLDDTNLARVVSGVLDSNTGIITFTRDDNTTFTVDASSLLDNQNASEVPIDVGSTLPDADVLEALERQQTEINLNTAKVSADGSIDTHSDVDTTTTPPSNGDALVWDGSNFVPGATTTGNGFTIFSIWAEESGALNANSRQWSFGNGATGNINIVIPIDAELFALSFDVETGTGNATIEVMQDDLQVFESKQFTNKDFEVLTSPIAFTIGQYIGFRTGEDNGNFSDVRVAAWFRVKATPASTSLLNDLLDVSISTPANGEALVYNGTSFTNTAVVQAADLSTVAFSGDYNDLSNKPLLGTAADNDEGDFATAAQGLLADSALQSGDNVSELTNDSGYITSAQAPVQSVAGKTGTVTLNSTDVGLSNVPNVDATDADNVVVDPIAGVTGTDVQTVLENINSNAVTDHDQLAGLLDDDHPQYLNEGRHDSLPQDNPHTVTFTQAVSADAGTDISATEAETLTDGSNADLLHQHTSTAITDFNSAASAAAPVQPGDIANFETTTQLNARDVANRNRANHTGTQLASTISDFSSAVNLAETTTSLSILGNVLTYTDEDGNASNIDLSIYLDDTNLARLVSGTIDANGIVTFTRDDNTTFTVDFSSLNDQAAIAQAITDHEALPDPHPQYTTAAEASAAAPVQPADIANFETSTQLDARDVNNRNRANHTGTQLASTISDFNSAASTAAPVQSVNGQTGTVSLAQNDLTDTVITTPQLGQIIQYNGSQWVNASLNTDTIITQNGHGFSLTNNVPLPAYVDTFGNVQLAIANNLATLSAFYITEIIDANNFKIQNNGIITASSHGLNVGEYYFLSNATLGAVTTTEPLTTINDVVFFVVDPNTLILLDNRPEDKNSLEKFIIKVSNTDTATNINTGTNTQVPITGTTVINENTFYTVVGNGIQVPQTRTYSVKINLHVGTIATRANQLIRLAVNGTPTGPIAATGYIRNSSGHNESSYHLEDVLVLNVNDIVTIVSTPEAGGGTVTLETVGTSTMIIEAR